MISATSTHMPAEIKKAVAALDGDPRWKIIEILMDEPDGLSYTQILELMGTSKSDLTYHLDKLVKGAILDNYSKSQLSLKYESYYALSSFGIQILKGLMSALSPAQPAVISLNEKENLVASGTGVSSAILLKGYPSN